MSDSRSAILAASIEILRDPDGPALTLESAARRAGLSKPGLMYHFPTKQALVTGVITHVVGGWSDRIGDAVGRPAAQVGATERIGAYVTTVFASEFDLSDVAVFFQVHYRAELSDVWVERMEPWLHVPDDLPAAERSRLTAARLAVDGYWYAAASGWGPADRQGVADAILELLG